MPLLRSLPAQPAFYQFTRANAETIKGTSDLFTGRVNRQFSNLSTFHHFSCNCANPTLRAHLFFSHLLSIQHALFGQVSHPAGCQPFRGRPELPCCSSCFHLGQCAPGSSSKSRESFGFQLI